MKTVKISLRATLVFTLLLGGIYPLSVTGLAQLLWPSQSGGSLVSRDGRIVGSESLAQSFSQPHYFWPRPSAIQYEAASSGGSNFGVNAPDHLRAVKERQLQGAVAEMRYASGSGLDPHISPAAARAQIKRIAGARQLAPAQIRDLETLVEDNLEARQFGFLGQPRVNVLRLNLALKERFGK